jgi:hypothetical protein
MDMTINLSSSIPSEVVFVGMDYLLWIPRKEFFALVLFCVGILCDDIVDRGSENDMKFQENKKEGSEIINCATDDMTFLMHRPAYENEMAGNRKASLSSS